MDAMPSMADPPFACPPDIVLDLPPPISLNRSRKIDWTVQKRLNTWKRGADAYVFAAKCRTTNPLRLQKIPRFELTIVLCDALNKLDLDNALKSLIDYLCQIELIEDDGKNHMRRLVVEWGAAPSGCRVTVKPCA